MGFAKRVIEALLITGAAALFLPPSASTQERVGVVTNIEGIVTVARLTLPQTQPLGFKDDVLLHDRITTGERSFVRVLLGGKATVTARERSILTITEVPGVATVQLGEGRISVAVSKGLMKPGETVEIKTPNAVTAIRGTVVVAEVSPVPDGYQSTITILRGLVEVTKLDPAGRLVGPAVKVGALERVAVTDSKPIAAPETIPQEAAKRLASAFSLVPKHAPAASLKALNTAGAEASIRLATPSSGGSVHASGGAASGTGSHATSGTGSHATSGTGSHATGGVTTGAGSATPLVPKITNSSLTGLHKP